MSSSSSICSGGATDRPWFLTLNSEVNEVFVWKSGIRLKLKDGSSSGTVTEASVLSAAERTITVSDVC